MRTVHRLALTAALLASPAKAEEGLVGELKGLEVERGGVEIESRMVHATRDGPDALDLDAALAYGLSDSLQLGTELKTERTPLGREAAELALFLKWKAVDPAAGFGIGFQAGLVLDPDDGRVGSESMVIAQGELAGFDLTANLVLLTEPGEWREIGSSYGARIERELAEFLVFGIETGGTLDGEGEGSHFAGPVIDIPFGERRPSLGIGLFAPLSSRAPDFQARIGLEWEL